jgi:hypothetical protein
MISPNQMRFLRNALRQVKSVGRAAKSVGSQVSKGHPSVVNKAILAGTAAGVVGSVASNARRREKNPLHYANRALVGGLFGGIAAGSGARIGQAIASATRPAMASKFATYGAVAGAAPVVSAAATNVYRAFRPKRGKKK